jgi:DNA invertase Pin-like site-specific DNA recombinase
MLDRAYDPSLPYRFACYGRMSDPRQNRRSPDQQFNTIDEGIARCGYPWRCVATYRDDGISGRYLRKRLGFQRLLRDIEAGLIRVDLVVVDTLERLGRADEIAELRRRLFVEHGVLIVAADNSFSDPTGVVGKAVGLVEQIRSTENTRITRHNVLRGKKDAARLGHWPGGPPPFGFRLKPMLEEHGAAVEAYSVLEVEPRAAAALRLAFERAAATGHGDLRLSQWWNACPEIPDDFKPLSPFTLGYRLKNPIAIGTLRWGAHRTGVVNDTRVVELNPDGPELLPGFCPPIVSVALFERVQELRRLRGEQIKRIRKARELDSGEAPKLIAPQGQGLTLKYLLTGLVRCAGCNASMRPVPSGRRSKGGRRYVYYTCPRHNDGACGNGRHVPEDHLRQVVIAHLRARLFPPPKKSGPAPPWLSQLLALVRQEHQRRQADAPNQEAADQEELRQLERQMGGWAMTLANPQLPAAVRADIELRYAQGKERQHKLQARAARVKDERARYGAAAREVVAALRELAEVLSAFNPTLGNRELGKHIEVILCGPDGRVELRGTQRGVFEGTIVQLSRRSEGQAARRSGASEHAPVVPRRRGRLRVPQLSAEKMAPVGDDDLEGNEGPDAELVEQIDWAETPVLEPTPSWSAQHAAEVAGKRAAGLTHAQLAAHFGVSVPTIRKALQLALQGRDTPLELPRKMPRPRWPEQHFPEVARLHGQGMSVQELCQHFARSEPLVRRALRLAAERTQQPHSQAGSEERSPSDDPPRSG